jgi:hypothetical protein
MKLMTLMTLPLLWDAHARVGVDNARCRHIRHGIMDAARPSAS